MNEFNYSLVQKSTFYRCVHFLPRTNGEKQITNIRQKCSGLYSIRSSGSLWQTSVLIFLQTSVTCGFHCLRVYLHMYILFSFWKRLPCFLLICIHLSFRNVFNVIFFYVYLFLSIFFQQQTPTPSPENHNGQPYTEDRIQ